MASLALVLLYFMSVYITAEDTTVLYTDISIANTTQSLHRLRDVTLQYYSFKYDTVAGRRQMGILGKEAEKFFPESVEVVPTYTFPSKEKGKPPVIFQNFPIVDKNAIFMHGLAALKELISLYDGLNRETEEIKGSSESRKKTFIDIEKKLNEEFNQQVIEQEKVASAESEYSRQKRVLDSIQSDEFRKTMALELSERKSLLLRQEELGRQGLEYELLLAQRAANESIQLERELLEKRETLRRESAMLIQEKRLSYEQELEQHKTELEMEKIRAEIAAKAEAERAAQQQAIRQLETQAALDTQRMVETVRTVSRHLSKLVADMLSKPLQIAIVAAAILGMMSLYYLITSLASGLRQIIQTRLGRPSLVRETSVRWTVPLLSWCWSPETLDTGLKQIVRVFEGVILAAEDRESVIQLALSTRNTKRSNAPFRHVLLHGPPGTGKTLIARRLAEASGMDYAIMSGGDVGPLGEDAVTQLHSLFKWASNSRKGLLVFIDEAEAFLSSRGNMSVEDAHLRHALNALLYQTGTQSRQFMLVLATNRPSDLDSAVLDRMDVSLHIKLPALEQRIHLLNQYFRIHVLDTIAVMKKRNRSFFHTSQSLDVEEKCYSKPTILSTAKAIQGFSGREISKIMIAMQYTLMLADKGILTSELFNLTVQTKLKEHREKRGFITD
mmetsp:Transcript_2713/g.2868  ORF Transcript_2713/g.2868 Transcript_2713/m.2868 type:complete len:671 (+) Transcript_2713:188-2200(+)|eukprot:CAMPEP_0182436374 /NCGR_PEP_ID=MMETSP1167-20130531/81175_1 /TAXON_ID=2988 /ORGANISM="Mallomonas Sp, Strain CCMP3275" /LENGTH=670 /DNA_ID=CAMNT_0024628483 /DNA_START=73 /DNA_END=2085 /DNA_ORIENTATION=-